MRTLKQIEAARRNGAKSKGPTTSEGKATSAKNATKHGLSAAILSTENEDDFNDLLHGYLETWQPANANEYDLVCQIVTASLRLQRIARMEAQLFESQFHLQLESMNPKTREFEEPIMEGKAWKSLVNNGRSLDLILRYTSTARRNYDAALKTLRDLQRERRKAEIQNEPGDTQLLTKPTASRGRAAAAADQRTPSLLTFPAANDQSLLPRIQSAKDDIGSAPPEDGGIDGTEC